MAKTLIVRRWESKKEIFTQTTPVKNKRGKFPTLKQAIKMLKSSLKGLKKELKKSNKGGAANG